MALDAFRGFHRNFWLINALELVERGAYYGMTAIFVLHFRGLGLSESFIGLMGAVLVFFAYFFPVVAGALAEKFGFRRSMLVAFALGTAGYIALGATGGFASLGDYAMLPGILLLGVGAGLFKPIAASVIAQTTTTAQRGFGYTIYYAGINIGGFLGPLLIGLFVPVGAYAIVFVGAAAFSVLNLVVLALVYRDQHAAQSQRTVAQALARLAGVRHDRWFLLLLVCYSGLWFMYAQHLYFAPVYFTDFVTGMPAWFTPALVNTINPGVIILVGPFLGRALSKYPSLPVVIGGILVYVAGALLTGLNPAASLFLLGIALASFGEVVAQPNFLSYVSKVAPEGKLAAYMGYGFVPVGVGLVVGLATGGILYETFAIAQRTPALFWGIASAVGAASIAGMLVVNRRMASRQPDAIALQGKAQRAVDSRVAPLAVLVLVPLVLLAGAAPGAQPLLTDDPGPGPMDPGAGALRTITAQFEGTTAEGDSREVAVAVGPGRAEDLVLTLRWTDEPASPAPLPGAAATNQPDTFRLSVATADGRSATSEDVANPVGGEGVVTLRIPEAGGPAAPGTYRVRIEMVQAGDIVVGPGLPGPQDGGNAWTLEASHRAP
jgi:proton-dependent oligopeptide transporter, POT family